MSNYHLVKDRDTPDTAEKPFIFKQFSIKQDQCIMKIGTDGVMLGAWAEVSDAENILDIGTGSGVIALMLAQRSPTSFITGVEIDEAACLQASENMANSPWWNRLRAVNASIQDFSKSTVITFDLIVSNPPFFSGGTFSHTQSKNSVRHTVKLPHGDLLYAVKNLLGTNGRFCTVLPNIEGLRFKELAANYGLFCSRLTEVYSAKGKPVERLLMCFERAVKPIERNKLSIQSESGQLSDEYVRLTEDFYLNL